MPHHFKIPLKRSFGSAAVIAGAVLAPVLLCQSYPARAQSASQGSASSPTMPAPSTPAPSTPAPQTAPDAKPKDGASAQSPNAAPNPAAKTTPTPSDAKPLPPIPVKTAKPKPRVAPAPVVERRRAPAAPRAPSAPSRPAPVQPAPQPAPAAPSADAGTQPGDVGAMGEAAGGAVGRATVNNSAPATSNTADMLTAAPGVSVYQGGGVSDLPVIHGMEDDRVRVTVNGMALASACANHMNPVLSYVDPKAVKRMDVIAGVTPVSAGGDSIGGSVVVETLPPSFSDAGERLLTSASLATYVRSNGLGVGGSVSGSAATDRLSASYTGAWTRSQDYDRGDGAIVRSTDYEAGNQTLTLAARNGASGLLTVDMGMQHIPYQGFVNQRMDMTGNESWYVNSHYETKADWGKLDVRAYAQNVQHYMNFLADKGGEWPTGGMPMYTDGWSYGYSVKADVPLTVVDTLRFGNELQGQFLDDWWPSLNPIFANAGWWGQGKPGMCCNTFWNIHGGERNRLGTYIEWERRWPDTSWTTLLGGRNDIVLMDTGDVQGYNDTNTAAANGRNYIYDANIFNAKDHARLDVNFDLTAVARYEPDPIKVYEGGYARKTRSPNLYERYAWSTGRMAMTMNGWYGDANGYVGDINLDPEVAHTISFTSGWHDPAKTLWDFKITPYYTYVEDFIDVNRCYRPGTPNSLGNMASCSAANLRQTVPFVYLQWANHDAQLYGVDLAGRWGVWRDPDYGQLVLKGVLGVVYGENLDTNETLYHMMPFNTKMTLEHKWGHWTNAIEFLGVEPKDNVQQTRTELRTPGYALVNLRSSYEWEKVRVDLGVENLFDQLYYTPLGGLDYADCKAAGGSAGCIGALAGPVPAMGRSFYAGVTIKF